MKQLKRSLHDRKLAGVIGGLAQYMNIDAALARVIFVIGLIVTGFMPLLLIYIILIFVIPNEKGDHL